MNEATTHNARHYRVYRVDDCGSPHDAGYVCPQCGTHLGQLSSAGVATCANCDTTVRLLSDLLVVDGPTTSKDNL